MVKDFSTQFSPLYLHKRLVKTFGTLCILQCNWYSVNFGMIGTVVLQFLVMDKPRASTSRFYKARLDPYYKQWFQYQLAEFGIGK